MYRYYDEKTKQNFLHIGPQLYLPAAIYVTTRSECRLKEKMYTEAQAVREAQKRLSLFLDEYRAKGVEVVEDRVEIRCEDGTCTAKGKIILREAFGKIQEITAPPDGAAGPAEERGEEAGE